MEGKQYAVKLLDDLERQATKPLEIVHLAVYGPMRNMFVGGTRCFVTFMDDFLSNV